MSGVSNLDDQSGDQPGDAYANENIRCVPHVGRVEDMAIEQEDRKLHEGDDHEVEDAVDIDELRESTSMIRKHDGDGCEL